MNLNNWLLFALITTSLLLAGCTQSTGEAAKTISNATSINESEPPVSSSVKSTANDITNGVVVDSDFFPGGPGVYKFRDTATNEQVSFQNVTVLSEDNGKLRVLSDTLSDDQLLEKIKTSGETKIYGYIVEFRKEPVAKTVRELLSSQREADVKKLSESNKELVRQMVRELKQDLQTNMIEIKNKLGKQTLAPKNEFVITFNGVALDISKQEAKELESLSFVKRVSPNLTAHSMLMDSVPLINADDVWQLNQFGTRCTQTTPEEPDTNPSESLTQTGSSEQSLPTVDGTREPEQTRPPPIMPVEGECLTGKGVTIGIIDTGVDYTHPDLGGCIGPNCKVIGGYDFINNDNDPMDDHGHGTHVAATAAGNGVLKGVAPDAKIIAYKVLDMSGSGPMSGIIEAIERSADPNQDGSIDDHLDVINLSLGLDCKLYFGRYTSDCGPDDPMSLVIDNATDLGVVAVIAAGNRGLLGQGSVGSPGTSRKAITVGAVDKQRQLADFTALGPTTVGIKPDIVAPGVSICAAQHDSWLEGQAECTPELPNHIAIDGTSMATPHVAGMTALLKQINSDLSAKQIKDILKQNASNLNSSMLLQGHGLIDALASIQTDKGTLNPYTGPVAELISPEGETPRTDQILTITGTVEGGSWSIYSSYNQGLQGRPPIEDWVEICSGTNLVNENALCNWDTGPLRDGVYLLKLVTTNSQGRQSFDESVVNLVSAKIVYPEDLYEIFPRWGSVIPTWQESLNISGTVAHFNGNRYSMRLCANQSPFDCQTIEPTPQQPFQPIINGELALFSISNLGSGYYTATLLLYDAQNNLIGEDSARFYIEADMQRGWPKTIEVEGIGPFVFS